MKTYRLKKRDDNYNIVTQRELTGGGGGLGAGVGVSAGKTVKFIHAFFP
jgi:hypothetical protein